MKTELVSGFFLVAVRSSFPIEGVDFILGNDKDGGNVDPFPEVIDVLIESDELAHKHPDVYAVSARTRAQAHKQAETDNLICCLFLFSLEIL